MISKEFGKAPNLKNFKNPHIVNTSTDEDTYILPEKETF